MRFSWGARRVELAVERLPDGRLRVTLPGGETRTVGARLFADAVEVAEGDRIWRVPLARDEAGALSLAWEGAAYRFVPERPGARPAARAGSLASPMGGVVAEVKVTAGEAVEAYQPLAVVEAMKVLATIEAPFAGTVRAVHIGRGDRVEHGQILVEIAP